MKFHKIGIVFLSLLIMTMGVVCAEDANQTVTDTLQLNDTQDVISDASEMSYDDLSKKINSRLIGFISLLFGIMFMFILCFSLHCIFTIILWE